MSIFDIEYIDVVWKLLVPPDKRLPKWLAWGSAVMQGKDWKGNTFFKGYMQGAQYLIPTVLPSTNGYNNSATYHSGDRVIYLVQAAGAYYGDNAVYEALCINADGSINLSGFLGIPPTGSNVAPGVMPDTITNSTQALAWLYNASVNYPVWMPQSYTAGQIVLYTDGYAYTCIADATSAQTPTDPLHWQIIPTSKAGCLWVQVNPNFIGANERASYSCQKTIYEYALNKWFNTTFRQPLTPTTSDTGSDIFIGNINISSNNFTFFPVKTGGSYFLAATNISDKTKPLSKYFTPDSVFSQQYDFSINVPIAVYNSLDDEAPVTVGHNTANRDGIVRLFADLLCPAGANYNIVTY